MGSFDNNHYVQKALLKYFANDKGEISCFDIKTKCLERAKINNTFSEDKLYDIKGEDPKRLEQDLNILIESKIGEIFKKINNINGEIVKLNSIEENLIKKYLLVQIYRNKANGETYNLPVENDINTSDFYRDENETDVDVWKKEIKYILEHTNEEILKSKFWGIKKYAEEILPGGLFFVRTDREFCINDMGYACERQRTKYPNPNKLLEELKRSNMVWYHKVKNEIENDSAYLDNFIMMPFGPQIAVCITHPVWLYYRYPQGKENVKILGLNSSVIEEYYYYPIDYMGDKLYTIRKLDNGDDDYLNKLMITQAKYGVVAQSNNVLERYLK